MKLSWGLICLKRNLELKCCLEGKRNCQRMVCCHKSKGNKVVKAALIVCGIQEPPLVSLLRTIPMKSRTMVRFRWLATKHFETTGSEQECWAHSKIQSLLVTIYRILHDNQNNTERHYPSSMLQFRYILCFKIILTWYPSVSKLISWTRYELWSRFKKSPHCQSASFTSHEDDGFIAQASRYIEMVLDRCPLQRKSKAEPPTLEVPHALLVSKKWLAADNTIATPSSSYNTQGPPWEPKGWINHNHYRDIKTYLLYSCLKVA